MQTAVDPQLLAPGATVAFCATFSDDCRKHEALKAWRLRPDLAAGPPYALADGRVRIAWLKDGKLQYLSFITFDGAKVKDISTLPAQIPMKASD